MKKNQPIIIYFTSTGRWSSVINDIDYGNTYAENTGVSAVSVLENTGMAGSLQSSTENVSIDPSFRGSPPAGNTPVMPEASPNSTTPAASKVSTLSLLPAAPKVPSTVTKIPAAVKISGALPPKGSSKLYRIQVGSFLLAANVTQVFNKLKEAGLNPANEKYGQYTRVVLAGIKADDIALCMEKIDAAGFREVWCREE
ncbi:hypothetical protein FACS1894140_6480 [Spirochaetia bacterium]|nr:hypothetical protein FACS1894140_6480 [Spirochaetia bacterium]